MNYELNDEGNLTYLGIALLETPAGIMGISPLDNSKYTIEGMTLLELPTIIERFTDFIDEFDEVLNMVGSLGGGKWRDDPSGTSTTYEYDKDRKMLHVTEE
jgi:hypothetical protein